jgi:hypothetical protein
MMSKPKKLKKFRFKRLLVLGLCNLTSGIVFGTGCLIAEHIDSSWRVIILGGNEDRQSGKMSLDLVLSKLSLPEIQLACLTPPKIIALHKLIFDQQLGNLLLAPSRWVWGKVAAASAKSLHPK